MKTVALAALLSVSALAAAPKAPGAFRKGLLADRRGMTLYVFDKDEQTPGKSACVLACARNWPPLRVSKGDAGPAGDWGVIARSDGGKQWTYKGRPVYRWSKDKKPGRAGGDGFNGFWHVVKAGK